ncbi:hypothetical protein V2J09_006020 [Rumex salicifolius]
MGGEWDYWAWGEIPQQTLIMEEREFCDFVVGDELKIEAANAFLSTAAFTSMPNLANTTTTNSIASQTLKTHQNNNISSGCCLAESNSAIPDLLSAVTGSGFGFGVPRGKRMARQRRTVFSVLATTPISSSSSSSSPSSSCHVPLACPPHPTYQAIDRKRLKFLFKKQLQNSDVGSLRRMVLPKKAAEAHLPPLEVKEGIMITMEDIDGCHIWSFKYRFWPNNNSRMYVLENTGDFVNIHQLEPGDFIMVYQDFVNLNYVIQARKASEQEDEYNGTMENAANYDLFQGYTVNKSNELSWTDVFPNENSAMTYVYDTSFFEDDSPLDYMGGAHYYSKNVGPPNFGSVDSLSLEEFPWTR